jgi:hypothetical protein
MAISQAKRSRSSAQSRAPQPASTTIPKTNKKRPRRRRRKLPLLPPPVITRRGQTTIRRYSGRSVHHMEEVKGKIVECVEFYTSSESHSIDVCFQDKTTLHFSIDPGFLLETEYADWKTGNWQRIKRWPTLRSATSSSV